MKLELPELPFAKDALAPHMSADTLDFHHGKHHNAYVVKGNELLEGAGLEADSLEQLVMEAAKAPPCNVGGARLHAHEVLEVPWDVTSWFHPSVSSTRC